MKFLDETGQYLDDQVWQHPPMSADISVLLIGFLERQRATFAWKCGGLDADQLRVTVGSSPMTLGGMLKHMARFEDDMSSERILGQEQRAPWRDIDWELDHDWDWRTAAEEPPELLYARWQDSTSRCRSVMSEALAAGALDRPGIAYLLVNMIEEYARHNGHADLIRESVDGLVGHDPPGRAS